MTREFPWGGRVSIPRRLVVCYLTGGAVRGSDVEGPMTLGRNDVWFR
jgi:hypothetical protein